MNRPLPYLRSERVLLRLAIDEDISQIIAFYRENAAHFEKVSSSKPDSFYTNEFWTQKIKSSREDFQADRSCNFFVFNMVDELTVLGFVNFFSFIRGAFHASILGYGLAQSAQGKGLMTEALTLAIDFAFDELNLHRIMANHSPTNIRSASVLRRLNFVPEGYARDYLLVNGKWQDHVLNALSNSRWQPPQI
ncbi:MAG: GNAT family N-acetyltransferase [Pleurocapsa sp. CRU_1_2]|nr:GNAT family N-acetyltransferase [Pleurocapsa sp. CRU_1_2]